jgi:predicted nucleic acid-binding protein
LVCEWHEFHAATIECLTEFPADSWVVCSHVLLECFAVLTRLPPPYRLSSASARDLLTANFLAKVSICPVSEADISAALELVAEQNLAGGMVYDAVIAHSVSRAGASKLLTWNARHFALVAPPQLAIHTPRNC